MNLPLIQPPEPSPEDLFRLSRSTQGYIDNAGDAAFALSCFGGLIPFLSKPVVSTIDALRDHTAIILGENSVPLSACNRAQDHLTFTIENLKSGALSLMVEGAIKGLKGSGGEQLDSHISRMLTGYIIGSEISENTGRTYWCTAGRILTPSISELTGFLDSIFTKTRPTQPNNTIEQILEDNDLASHYRFAGAAAKFVLACSLASEGALRGDVLVVANRINDRIRKTCPQISERMLTASLRNESPYAEPTEAGLTIAAIGDGYSLPAIINAMRCFVPIETI